MKPAILIALLAAAALGAEPGFLVVVNEENPVSSLSREELSELFLKKKSTWPDGSLVLPVDQLEETEVREVFNRDIHRKRSTAIRAYWQQRIFSGRDVPPPEKESDANVILYVRRHSGAIGYVSTIWAGAGVKTLVVRK
jgi:ABC-type phosphate transport system substrate-binding protein